MVNPEIREENYRSYMSDSQHKSSLEIRHALWYAGDLSYKLNRLQLAVRDKINFMLDDPLCMVMTFVNMCCRQFGKSYLSTVLALEDAIRYPGSAVYFFAPQKEQCHGIVSEKLQELCFDAPPGFIRENASDMEWYIGPPERESVIRIHGLLGQGKESRRGFKGFSLFFEETRDIASKDYKKILGSLVPLLTHSKRKKIMHNTTMTYDPHHAFLRTTVDKAKRDGSLFNHTIDDIPEDILSKDDKMMLINEISAGEGMNSPEVLREFYNVPSVNREFCAIPGFIPSGKKGSQVRPVDVRKDIGYMTVGDLGYEEGKSKTVFMIIGYDVVIQKMMVFDEEVIPVEASDEEIVRRVSALERMYISGTPKRFIDADGRSRRGLAALGFHFDQVDKSKRDEQIHQLRRAFTGEKIEIHQRCKFTLTVLEYGQVDHKGKNKYHDQYGHNDPIDVIRYAWRHREEAAANVDGLTTGELYRHPDLTDSEMKRAFVGVSWQDGAIPSYFTAMNERGEILKIWGHRGFRKDRVRAFADFVGSFRQAEMMQDSDSVSSRMISVLQSQFSELDSVSLNKMRADLWMETRDLVNDGDVKISSYHRLEREFADSHGLKSDDYPLVDSFLLANNQLAEWQDLQEKIKRGNLISLDEIAVREPDPEENKFLGIYCDKDGYWHYVIKGCTEHTSRVTGFSDIPWSDPEQMLDSIDLEFVGRAATQKEHYTRILSLMPDRIWLYPSDTKKYTDHEMLDSLLSQRESWSGNDPDDYIVNAVLYPDGDRPGIVVAGRLAESAAVQVSVSEVLLDF